MRQNIKEKAGIVDTLRIFEGLHLSDKFIANMADEGTKMGLDKEIVKEGERHFGICGKCRSRLKAELERPEEQGLPL